MTMMKAFSFVSLNIIKMFSVLSSFLAWMFGSDRVYENALMIVHCSRYKHTSTDTQKIDRHYINTNLFLVNVSHVKVSVFIRMQ